METSMKSSTLLLAAILCFGAGALRFYKLGDWPFTVDEVMTIEDADAFINHL
jgi:hypothetical protein